MKVMWAAFGIVIVFLFQHYVTGLDKKDAAAEEAIKMLSERTPPKAWIDAVTKHVELSEIMIQRFILVEHKQNEMVRNQELLRRQIEKQQGLILELLREVRHGNKAASDARRRQGYPDPAPHGIPAHLSREN